MKDECVQLQPNLWLAGLYYIDIDPLGQLRIVGPYNHLHFGSIAPLGQDMSITDISLSGREAEINFILPAKEVFWHDPAMGHIRKVRDKTKHEHEPARRLRDVMKQHIPDLFPTYIAAGHHGQEHSISYLRFFNGHAYGSRLILPPEVKCQRVEGKRGFRIHTAGDSLKLSLRTVAEHKPAQPAQKLFQIQNPLLALNPEMESFFNRAGHEINHLLLAGKTSGYDYGTVFPRDWMEAADLGEGDLSNETIMYMYHRAAKHISSHGEGWHEDTTGEFRVEQRNFIHTLTDNLDDLTQASDEISSAMRTLAKAAASHYINRNMIDIEPHYLLGLKHLAFKDLHESDRSKFRSVAEYLLTQAEKKQFITFKRLPGHVERQHNSDYFSMGDWRDSRTAYKAIHPVIAPYSVNAVLYPQALEVMRELAEVLRLDIGRIDSALDWWREAKSHFLFTNKDGMPAYALALYDIKGQDNDITYKLLKVNHTDEAYNLFYGIPTEADVTSFARRLLDEAYFYTPSGPTIVGAADGYTTQQYHGRVIWTKQTALTVAGLERQWRRAAKDGWSRSTADLLMLALTKTSESSLAAFKALKSAPELHYDDEGTARRYDDQPAIEGTMNTVQLWSAVGARRIIRVHNEIKGHDNN